MRLVTTMLLALMLVGLPLGLSAQTITPIKDIQMTTDPSGDSPLNGQVVTITGRVTGQASTFGSGYYVQDAEEAWSGIFVADTDNKPERGDSVTVTGTVNENFGLTRLESVTSFTIDSIGRDLTLEKRLNPFEPIVVSIADANPGEQYEGVLVRIDSVSVSSTNADAPNNDFGEWVITDGTDTLRVDDAGDYYYKPKLDDEVASIVGLLDYSFSDWKLQPRISNDLGAVNGARLISSVQQVLPGDDASYLFGDTIKVGGIAASNSRAVYIGQRWSLYAVMDEAMPWSGLQIVQEDSNVSATNMGAIQTGDRVVFTGRVSEFSQHTEFFQFDTPPVAVQFVDFNNPLPEPLPISGPELETIATGEPYEGVVVAIDVAEVVNNNADGQGRQMLVQAGGANVIVADHFMTFHEPIIAGSYHWPAIGTRLKIAGLARHLGSAGFSVNPRTMDDIEVLSIGPSLSDITRDKTAPTSTEDVVVSSSIKAVDAAVTDATLGYSVNFGDFTLLSMTSTTDTTYEATIPAQSDGDFVMYFISATDAEGDETLSPDTTSTMYFYTVRDQGLTIRDLQYTPFKAGNTGYAGLEVTVTGLVTMGSDDFGPPGSNYVPGTYYIQDGRGPYTGILVSDPAHTPSRGDRVTVTGTAGEQFNITRITDVDPYTVVSSGNPVPEPVLQTTGNVTTGADSAEAYESVLIEFHNLQVTNPFPDGADNNHGEFSVDDGTGPVRVDDGGNWSGNLDSDFALGDSIRVLRGIHFYSFDDFKLMPRGLGDVVDHITDVERRADLGVPERFALYENYPNPFNPSTTIRFEVPKDVRLKLTVHNLLGRQIRSLVDGPQASGVYTVVWDGRDNAGIQVASGVYFYRLQAADFVQTKKMLLLK
jgi:hypothetical protein